MKSSFPAAARAAWPWVVLTAALTALHFTAVSGQMGGNMGGDNVIYFLLARAIATGKGYVDLYLPGTPPHVKFPFLFPLLLAPWNLVSDKPLWCMHAMVAGFNVAAALMIGILARKRFESVLAGIFIGAAAGTIPAVYLQSLHLLSEPVYMAFAYGALLALPERGAKSITLSRLALITSLSLAAYFTRSAGVALVGAVAIALLWNRFFLEIAGFRVPAGIALAFVFILAGFAWWLRNRLAAGAGSVYLGEFLAFDPTRPELGSIGLAGLIARIKTNLSTYGNFFIGYSVSPSRVLQNPALDAVLALFILAGLARDLITGGRVLGLFFIFSLTIAVLWPFQDTRFLLPAAPIALLFLFSGLDWAFRAALGKKAPGLSRKLAVFAIPVLLTFQINITRQLMETRLSERWGPAEPVTIRGYGVWTPKVIDFSKSEIAADLDSAPGRDLMRKASEFFIINSLAGTLTEPDAVMVSRKPMWTYYLSGRQSLPELRDPDIGRQWDYWRKNRVDYLVLGLDDGAMMPAVEAALVQDRGLAVTAQIEGGGAIIKVDRLRLPLAPGP